MSACALCADNVLQLYDSTGFFFCVQTTYAPSSRSLDCWVKTSWEAIFLLEIFLFIFRNIRYIFHGRSWSIIIFPREHLVFGANHKHAASFRASDMNEVHINLYWIEYGRLQQPARAAAWLPHRLYYFLVGTRDRDWPARCVVRYVLNETVTALIREIEYFHIFVYARIIIIETTSCRMCYCTHEVVRFIGHELCRVIDLDGRLCILSSLSLSLYSALNPFPWTHFSVLAYLLFNMF